MGTLAPAEQSSGLVVMREEGSSAWQQLLLLLQLSLICKK